MFLPLWPPTCVYPIFDEAEVRKPAATLPQARDSISILGNDNLRRRHDQGTGVPLSNGCGPMLRQAGNSSENPERFRDEFLKFDFRLALEACYYCTMGQQPTHGHIVNVQRPRRDGVPCVNPH